MGAWKACRSARWKQRQWKEARRSTSECYEGLGREKLGIVCNSSCSGGSTEKVRANYVLDPTLELLINSQSTCKQKEKPRGAKRVGLGPKRKLSSSGTVLRSVNPCCGERCRLGSLPNFWASANQQSLKEDVPPDSLRSIAVSHRRSLTCPRSTSLACRLDRVWANPRSRRFVCYRAERRRFGVARVRVSRLRRLEVRAACIPTERFVGRAGIRHAQAYHTLEVPEGRFVGAPLPRKRPG